MENLIAWDKSLFLFLNKLHAPFLDNFMYEFSSTAIWIPLYLSLVYLIIVAYYKKKSWAVILFIVLMVVCCDQLSSSVFKPLFERLRPTHDPEIADLVHTVNNYRGGKFGFISSHAANSFGLATFIFLLFRNNVLTGTLFFWAILNSYSRIYLGVHYPLDVLCGALTGSLIACCLFLIWKRFFNNSNKVAASTFRVGNIVVLAVFSIIFILLILYSFFLNKNSF